MEGEGEKHQGARETCIGCLLLAPNGGPGPQPRRVPWPGTSYWQPFSFWNDTASTESPRYRASVHLFKSPMVYAKFYYLDPGQINLFNVIYCCFHTSTLQDYSF